MEFLIEHILWLLTNNVLLSVLTVVVVIVLLTLTVDNNFTPSSFTVLAYIILISAFTEHNVFKIAYANLGQVIGWVVAYLSIGALFSVLQYWNRLKTIVNIMQPIKAAFIEKYDLSIKPQDPVPSSHHLEWNRFRSESLSSHQRELINLGTSPSSLKGTIIGWITFWPFIAAGWFISGSIRRITHAIYHSLVDVYSKIYHNLVTKHINITDL